MGSRAPSERLRRRRLAWSAVVPIGLGGLIAVAPGSAIGAPGAAVAVGNLIDAPLQQGFDPAEWLIYGKPGTTPPHVVAPTDFGAGGGSWLQLTSDDTHGGTGEAGLILNQTPFGSDKGVIIEYDQRVYRTNTAQGVGAGDGISLFLVDANPPAAGGTNVDVTTNEPGGFGGGLGYASVSRQGSSWCPNDQGLAGAYFGIGFDVFGNFQKAEAGAPQSTRPQSVSLGSAAKVPQSIAVRGSGVRHLPDAGGTATCTNAGNQADLNYWYGMNTSTSPTNGGYRRVQGTPSNGSEFNGAWIDNAYQDGSEYRRVKISVTPEPGGARTVRVYWSAKLDVANDVCLVVATPCTEFGPAPGSVSFQQVFTTNLSNNTFQAALPAAFKIGLAASTGFANNYHQIRNLAVSTESDLQVDKLVNGVKADTVDNGETITYQIRARNNGLDTVPPEFPATLVDGLTGVPLSDVTWTATATGGAQVSVDGTTFAATASGSGTLDGPNALKWTAPPTTGGAWQIDVRVTGTVSGGPFSTTIPNTATVAANLTGGPQDNNPANDTSTASITVLDVPAVDIEKTGPATFASNNPADAGYWTLVTPGADADAPGDADVPTVREGESVTWAYVVTNTSQTVPLQGLVVTDVDADGNPTSVECPPETVAVGYTLPAGGSFTCRATSSAIAQTGPP
jgi:hypothetical protein